MAKQGFKRNHKVIGQILKTDEAAKPYAERILADINDPEARIERYVTDRVVFGIVVPADKQAKHGTATRAAASAGLKPI
jgi:hypothetical protein